MSVPSPKMWVAVSEPVVFLRIAGRADCTASTDFKRVVLQLLDRGYRTFQVDLSGCLIMDSTFLGVLAGIVHRFSPRDSSNGVPTMQLLNPNQRVLDLLDNLGVLNLFKLIHEPTPPPANMEPLPPSPHPTSKKEMSRNSLEAHRTLMNLNPANIPKFKEVAKFLAEDLKRLEADQTQNQ